MVGRFTGVVAGRHVRIHRNPYRNDIRSRGFKFEFYIHRFVSVRAVHKEFVMR